MADLCRTRRSRSDGARGYRLRSMLSSDREIEEAFWKRLLQRQPRWAGHVCRDDSKPWCRVSLVPPRWPRHALYLGDLDSASATVCYDDGSPPGPAEAHFDWSNPDNTSSAIDVMCDYAEDVIHGRTILVRKRLSRLSQFFRRHDCDSLLRFVERESFERWSDRIRRSILRAWSWTEVLVPPEPASGATSRGTIRA